MAIEALLKHQNNNNYLNEQHQQQHGKFAVPKRNLVNNEPVVQCNVDSDCGDIKKCCSVNAACPQHGRVCAKPNISNQGK
jgi:hypothetical protein